MDIKKLSGCKAVYSSPEIEEIGTDTEAVICADSFGGATEDFNRDMFGFNEGGF